MRRREFLEKLGATAASVALSGRSRAQAPGARAADLNVQKPDSSLAFDTEDAEYARTYDHALLVLDANCVQLPDYSRPVLIEGSSYRGIWLECGPHESLVYSLIRPDIARNNHTAFFETQREDGQFPDAIKESQIGWSQIQMVVPIAATAYELAHQTGDEALLQAAYEACSRWDAWLRRWRDTRHTGLCEGFCTYDTGHDNSPRWAGVPNQCLDHDARKCPPVAGLPRLCPDLSATVFGGRKALASMARALGKNSESDHWLENAEAIRKAILDRLYSPADAAFYDLDSLDKFVRIRGDLITRVLGEHVVSQDVFDKVWEKQIHSPAAFWAPYPLPSIAMDDPTFVRPKGRNSWGGASQALTAMRAPRWMEHYRHPAELAFMMQRWTTAIVRAGDFLQQMDPITGVFTPDRADYSPAALVFLDFTWRLSGVRREGDNLEWNVRPMRAKTRFSFRVSPTTTAEINYEGDQAQLALNGKPICTTHQVTRITTNLNGKISSLTGTADKPEIVSMELPGGSRRQIRVAPNQVVHIA